MFESPYLFVYGTLRNAAGSEWSRLLAGRAEWVGDGRTKGTLFRLGGYPGMVPSDGNREWVFGEIYRLTTPAMTLPVLDDYEGCGPKDTPPYEFDRREVPVLMDNGRRLQAWAYFYRGDTSGRERIPSGDYFQPIR